MKRFLACFILFSLVACGGNNDLPTTSLLPGQPDPQVRNTWSPYVGIHPYGGAQTPQLPYLQMLIDAGAVEGLRMDVNSSHSRELAQWALSHGIRDVLAIFPNEYLREPNVWEILDANIQQNPSITHWEIGNEVQGFINMYADEYMPIFTDLYLRAQEKYPHVTLIPQAPMGIMAGASELRGMLDHGLLDLIRGHDLRLVAIHYYSVKSANIQQMQDQIQRLPAEVEVWVTEAGSVTDQVWFVQDQYPKIQRRLRASRIYWYVLSECQSPSGDYSLVRGIPAGCERDPHVFTDLFQALTGRIGL